MTDKNTVEITNYEMFCNAINTLKTSQGFYSRIARDMNDMDEDELKTLEETLNNLPQKFNDVVDVVMFLEC